MFGTVKKSIPVIISRWLLKKAVQRFIASGGARRLGIYLETVLSSTLNPSFSSSPWIFGAPQLFSNAILSMRSRISLLMRGRPGFLGRDIHFQYRRKHRRCHFVTVSGWTRIRALVHFGQALRRAIQKAWSASLTLGLGRLSLKTASC